jgi:TRAP-type C4-dicarboxylate transport system substrate-binding protein
MKRNPGRTRREFVAFLGAFPIGFFSVRSNAQPRQLNLLCYYSAETFQGKGAQLLADKIAQAAAGAIQVSVEIPPILVPLDAIARGAALAVYCAPCVAKSEPLFNLSTLPMLAATFDEAETLHRIARPYYSAALARHDQILLATQPWPPGALWSTFPIRSVADLKGVAFAVVASPQGASDTESGWGRPFARLGARSVSFSDAEVAIASGYTGNIKLTQEFTYFTEIFFAAHLTFLAARQGVFDSLSETERRMLLGAGRDTEFAVWKMMREQLPRRQQEITARGVRVVAQPPADVLAALRETAEPDIQDWARSVGTDGGTILADYRRAIGRA